MRDCDRCDSRVSHINTSIVKNDDGSDIMVCDICYGSIIGNILRWPAQYSNDVVKIARMVAQVGNIILEKMNERI